VSLSEEFRFQNRNGDQLAGRLERPSHQGQTCAIFAHCFTCSKSTRATTIISRALAKRGIAVLRFDFTGLGTSEGEFAETNFSSNVSDLIDAAEALRAASYVPSLLVGHSLGGAAVLAAAGDIPEVRAVATIGAPAEPAHVTHLLGSATDDIERDGSAEIDIAGRSFRITKQFLDDISETRLRGKIHNLLKPLMILHAPGDSIVGIDNAAQIYKAAQHPKSFLSLDDADHLLSRREDAEFAAQVLAAWAGRYLQPDEEGPSDDEERSAAEGQDGIEPGVVRVDSRPGLLQSIRAGRHTFEADEPESAGGNDAGPTPYDLLLAALGACTSMTLQLYANRKGWPLEDVFVELRHSRIHADDCASCESENGMIDRLDVVVRVSGTLDDAQVTRLQEIARKCPVHRTLQNEKQIDVQLRHDG